MIKLLFTVFLFLLLLGSSDKEIRKEKLLITINNDEYIIYIDSSSLVRVINDTSNITQLVFENNEKIDLNFHITVPYLTSAYLCDIKKIGHVLILESTPIGASGLCAQITNVSIIALDTNNLWKVLSYNSFYGGIDLLKYQNGEIILTVYDFNGYSNNNNDMIYCMNTFEFVEKIFISKELTACFICTDKGLISKNNCSCDHLEEPYIYR